MTPTDTLFETHEALTVVIRDGVETLELSEERHPEGQLGAGLIVSLFNAWQEHEALRPLLQRVVGKPSLGALLHLAFSRSFVLSIPELTLDRKRFRLGTDGTWGAVDMAVGPDPGSIEVAGHTCHLEVKAGGEVLMDLELDMVDPVSPLSSVAGILEIRGVNRKNPDRRLRIYLVGAKRG